MGGAARWDRSESSIERERWRATRHQDVAGKGDASWSRRRLRAARPSPPRVVVRRGSPPRRVRVHTHNAHHEVTRRVVAFVCGCRHDEHTSPTRRPRGRASAAMKRSGTSRSVVVVVTTKTLRASAARSTPVSNRQPKSRMGITSRTYSASRSASSSSSAPSAEQSARARRRVPRR